MKKRVIFQGDKYWTFFSTGFSVDEGELDNHTMEIDMKCHEYREVCEVGTFSVIFRGG